MRTREKEYEDIKRGGIQLGVPARYSASLRHAVGALLFILFNLGVSIHIYPVAKGLGIFLAVLCLLASWEYLLALVYIWGERNDQ